MKTTRFFIISFFLNGSISGFAQSNVNIRKRVDSLLSKYQQLANIPGLSVTVAKNNEVVYSNSFGVSNIENKKEATSNTKFRIGSVTKLFTAVAAVRLIEQGRLNPDKNAGFYLPGLPPSISEITIRQLLGHLSGIRHYTRDETVTPATKEYNNLYDALEKFSGDTLVAKPGQKYFYSSYGYVLLGAIMEKVSGKKFTDIIQSEIIKPAKLQTTVPEYYKTAVNNTATFYYNFSGRQFTIAEEGNNSGKWAAGGYLSSSYDLALFGNWVVCGKATRRNGIDSLFTSLKTDLGKETNCGFGFRIGKDWQGRKVLHHGSESAGARSLLLIYPEEKLTIAIVANVFRAPLFEGEAETIASYFLKDFPDGKQTAQTVSFIAFDKNKTTDFKLTLKEGYKVDSFFSQPIIVFDVLADKKGNTKIITLSKTGIINLVLNKSGNAISGEWGYDRPVGKVESSDKFLQQ